MVSRRADWVCAQFVWPILGIQRHIDRGLERVATPIRLAFPIRLGLAAQRSSPAVRAHHCSFGK
jgi:hypothetical protein